MFRQTPNRAPPAPRPLTPDVEQDTQAIGRMFRIFGAVWGGLGTVGLAVLGLVAAFVPLVAQARVFPGLAALVGWTLFAVGMARRARARKVFRDGVEAEGQVASVGLDYRVRVNRKHPWRVSYRFQVEGRTFEGAYSCWTDSPPTVRPGDAVTVLYDAGSPGASVLWTRVAPVAELPAVRVAEIAQVPQGARVADGEEALEIDAKADAAPGRSRAR